MHKKVYLLMSRQTAFLFFCERHERQPAPLWCLCSSGAG